MYKIADRIRLNPMVHGGKPPIRNMRFTVVNMLEFLAGGMNFQDILEDYQYIEKGDIEACLQYEIRLRNKFLLCDFASLRE